MHERAHACIEGDLLVRVEDIILAAGRCMEQAPDEVEDGRHRRHLRAARAGRKEAQHERRHRLGGMARKHAYPYIYYVARDAREAKKE